MAFIDCLEQLKNTNKYDKEDLKDLYNSLIDEGLTDEQAGAKVISTRYLEILGDMNALKKSLGLPEDPVITQNDTVKELEDTLQELYKIRRAKTDYEERQAPSNPVQTPTTQPTTAPSNVPVKKEDSPKAVVVSRPKKVDSIPSKKSVGTLYSPVETPIIRVKPDTPPVAGMTPSKKLLNSIRTPSFNIVAYLDSDLVNSTSFPLSESIRILAKNKGVNKQNPTIDLRGLSESDIIQEADKFLDTRFELADKPIHYLSEGNSIKANITLPDLKEQQTDLNLNEELVSLVTPVMEALNKKGFEALIVGGSVRDALLGKKPKDLDIEVYGVSIQELESILYKYGRVDAVGKSFGVLKFTPYDDEGIIVDIEEPFDFSIPRRESKVGIGYKGFSTEFSTDINKEEASRRRDFTWNSMAYNPITKTLYDFNGGLSDLRRGIIRHTSPKFVEDPLRILRAMQFQGRMGHRIADETYELIKRMVDSGEMDTISKDRVREEWRKWAIKGNYHSKIFEFLHRSGMGDKYYPDLVKLRGTPQDPVYHPEGDVEEHTMQVLAKAKDIADRTELDDFNREVLIFSALLHDIAKPETTNSEYSEKLGRDKITARGHEAAGEKKALDFLSSIGASNDIKDSVGPIVREHLAHVSISSLPSTKSKQSAFGKLVGRMKNSSVEGLMLLMEADMLGRNNSSQDTPVTISEFSSLLQDYKMRNEGKLELVPIITGKHLLERGFKQGRALGDVLKAAKEAQINMDFVTEDEAMEWLSNYLANKDEASFMLAARSGIINLSEVDASISDKLAIFQEGLDKGINPETLFDMTSFYLDYFGNIRYETEYIEMNPDLDFDMLPLEANIPLREVIKNDKLFIAYPVLEDYNVYFLPSRGGQFAAQVDISKKVITISSVGYISRYLTHEIQHIIQSEEGLPSGTSVEAVQYFYTKNVRPFIEEKYGDVLNIPLSEVPEDINKAFLEEVGMFIPEAFPQGSLVESLDPETAKKIYLRTYGEVEAFAAQQRSSTYYGSLMSPMSIMSSLISKDDIIADYGGINEISEESERILEAMRGSRMISNSRKTFVDIESEIEKKIQENPRLSPQEVLYLLEQEGVISRECNL